MRERIKTISDRIISTSFPALKGKKIFYLLLPFRFFALSVWIPPFIRYIVISKRTRNFNDKVLTGILAHELSHQQRYLEMSFAAYMKFVVSYIFSGAARTAEEKATDRLTIEKGYGNELYELTIISHRDKNHKKILDNYLTPEEIKEYSISKGKWSE